MDNKTKSEPSIRDLMNMFRPDMARYENARYAIGQAYSLAFSKAGPAESVDATIRKAGVIATAMQSDLDNAIKILDNSKEDTHGAKSLSA